MNTSVSADVLAVVVHVGAPARDHVVEPLQPVHQDFGVERVEPRVDAVEQAGVAVLEAVVAVEPHLVGDLLVVGDHEAAVAERVEVLQRVRGEGADVAEGAAVLALVVGAHGLRRVLDHHEVVPARDIHDRVHVGDAPAPVHGHDGLGLRRDLLLDLGGIDVLVLAHVGIDRRGAHVRNRSGGGDEGDRRGDHLVALADAERPHAEHQGVGAVAAADAMLGAGVVDDLLLELADLLRHHQMTLGQDPVDARDQLVLLVLVALLQVDKRYFEFAH